MLLLASCPLGGGRAAALAVVFGGARRLFSAQLSSVRARIGSVRAQVRARRELKSDLLATPTCHLDPSPPNFPPLPTWRLIFGGASLSASLASALS